MALQGHAQDLYTSLLNAGLYPGITPLVPEDFTPKTELGVSYGEKTVTLGNLFRVSEVKTAPTISFAAEVSRTLLLY